MCEDEMVQSPSDGNSPALASWARGPGGRHRASRLPPPLGWSRPHPGSQLRGTRMERKEGGDTHAWVTARTTGDPGGDPRAAPSGDTEGAFAPWL